ncbi:MAG: hypothetical protein ACRDOK_28315, partial [Streptosporangiaceae bacterium]
MPAELLADPLGIACAFSNGRSRRWLISGDAGKSRLAADLLAGLAELVYPHGTVDSAKTIECYLVGLRDMAAFMAARGVAGGATALTRAVLVEYWMQAGPMRETWTRRMLAGYHAAAGVLDPAVLALTTGRHFTPQSRSTPLTPYTEQEWEKLQQEFRRVTDEAFNVHRHALAGAKSGCDPRDGGWNEDNLRHLLSRIGPCAAARVDAHLGKKPGWVVYHGGVRATCDELFPSATVAMAYRLLFGTVSGIVPDGVADLGVGDIEWAGDATVLLGYVKGRTAAESVTLPRRAVRLLEQWLEHSALLRRHAPPEVTGRLWLHYNYSGSPRWPATIARGTQAAVVKKRDLPPVDQRRIRTTYLSLRDRGSWHGSA